MQTKTLFTYAYIFRNSAYVLSVSLFSYFCTVQIPIVKIEAFSIQNPSVLNVHFFYWIQFTSRFPLLGFKTYILESFIIDRKKQTSTCATTEYQKNKVIILFFIIQSYNERIRINTLGAFTTRFKISYKNYGNQL